MGETNNKPPYLDFLLSKLPGTVETSRGWRAYCPCPSHGVDGSDLHQSLDLTVGEQGKLLLRCRVGCKLRDILVALCLEEQHLFCPRDQTPAPCLVSRDEQHDLENDKHLWARAYARLLELRVLTSPDAQWLNQQGLPEEDARRLGYRTLTSTSFKDVRAQLAQELGEDIESVPGLTSKDQNSSPSGIITPVRDYLGNVLAIKLRRCEDHPQQESNGLPRYYYLSTKGVAGPSPGSPCHVPLGTLEALEKQLGPSDKGETTLRITEGERKADVAFLLSGLPTLGVPGFDQWPKSLSTLEALCPSRVLVSFDHRDVLSKPAVASALCEFLKELQRLPWGPMPGVELWESHQDNKGIDDVLVAGQEVTVLWGRAAIEWAKSNKAGLENKGQVSSPLPRKASGKKPNRFSEPDLPPFPLHVYPLPVQDFCREVSNRIGAAIDFGACALLPVAGRAIGATRKVCMVPGWHASANIWMALVSDPSSGKSPSIDQVVRPLQKIQQDNFHVRTQEEKRHEKYLAACKDAKKNKEDEPAYVPPPRTSELMLTGDATTEAVGSLLHQNAEETARHDPSALVDPDELMGFVRGMNAYKGAGKGSDVEWWLKAAMGKPIIVHRKSGSSYCVTDHNVCVIGGLPRDRLTELRPNKDTDDGFLPRFLLTMPPRDGICVPNYRTGFNEQHMENWSRLILRLSHHLHMCHDSAEDYYRPEVIQPTPEARQVFQEWHENLGEESRSADFDRRYLGAWGKLPKHLCSLALILRLLRAACVSLHLQDEDSHVAHSFTGLFVEEEDVRGGIELISYFREQYRAVNEHIVLGNRDVRMEDFCKWVEQAHDGEALIRDIYRTSRWGCRTGEEAERFCRRAQELGLGEVLEIKAPRGRPRKVFVCPPRNITEEE